MSDSTWKSERRCGYRCKHNLIDKEPPPGVDRFPFIKMKLATHYTDNNPPSAVF